MFIGREELSTPIPSNVFGVDDEKSAVCGRNRYYATCQQDFLPYSFLFTFKVNLRCVATYKIELYASMTLKKTIKACCDG
jgi:hypothetical protein